MRSGGKFLFPLFCLVVPPSGFSRVLSPGRLSGLWTPHLALPPGAHKSSEAFFRPPRVRPTPPATFPAPASLQPVPALPLPTGKPAPCWPRPDPGWHSRGLASRPGQGERARRRAPEPGFAGSRTLFCIVIWGHTTLPPPGHCHPAGRRSSPCPPASPQPSEAWPSCLLRRVRGTRQPAQCLRLGVGLAGFLCPGVHPGCCRHGPGDSLASAWGLWGQERQKSRGGGSVPRKERIVLLSKEKHQFLYIPRSKHTSFCLFPRSAYHVLDEGTATGLLAYPERAGPPWVGTHDSVLDVTSSSPALRTRT